MNQSVNTNNSTYQDPLLKIRSIDRITKALDRLGLFPAGPDYDMSCRTLSDYIEVECLMKDFDEQQLLRLAEGIEFGFHRSAYPHYFVDFDRRDDIKKSVITNNSTYQVPPPKIRSIERIEKALDGLGVFPVGPENDMSYRMTCTFSEYIDSSRLEQDFHEQQLFELAESIEYWLNFEKRD